MRKLKYIVSDPKFMGGKPCFKGTRIAVSTVLDFLAAGDSVDSLLEEYPNLTRKHLKEALGVAANIFDIKGLSIGMEEDRFDLAMAKKAEKEKGSIPWSKVKKKLDL